MAANVGDEGEPGERRLVLGGKVGEEGGDAVGCANGQAADDVVAGLDGDGLREAVGEGGGEGGLGGDGGVEEVELGGLEDKVEVGEDGVGEAQDGVGEVAGDGRIVSLSRISTVLGTVEVQPKTRFGAVTQKRHRVVL